MILTSAEFDVPEKVDFETVFRLLDADESAELYHQFSPYGESWARFGRQRRMVVHTWPEHGIATVDVYDSERVDLSVLSEIGWRERKPATRDHGR